jgi:transposase, IS5 family
VTGASRHDGRMLRRGLLDRTNTGTAVWADSAYRSRANEDFMERHGFRSQVHHRKPKGRPMPTHIRRGNASRSSVRAAIEHVFAHQKGPMALCIRTIGIARARVKIGLANLTYNIRRLVFQERRPLARDHRSTGGKPVRHASRAPTGSAAPEPHDTNLRSKEVGRGAQPAKARAAAR